MTRSALQCLPGANVGLVRKYVDKKGQKRIVGLSEKLRQSQWLVCNLQYVCVCASLTCECMPLQVFVSCAFSLTCNIMELRQGLYSRLWKVHCEIGHGGS